MWFCSPYSLTLPPPLSLSFIHCLTLQALTVSFLVVYSWTQGRELRPLSMQRTERDRASRGWDPSVDAHLTRGEQDPAENERGWAMGKGHKVSRGGGWT